MFRNLCASCAFTFPECDATVEDIEFSPCCGEDEIIKCACYEPKDVEEEMKNE